MPTIKPAIMPRMRPYRQETPRTHEITSAIPTLHRNEIR